MKTHFHVCGSCFEVLTHEDAAPEPCDHHDCKKCGAEVNRNGFARYQDALRSAREEPLRELTRLREECARLKLELEQRQTAPRAATDLLRKLVVAIESDQPASALKRIIRTGAPILHCNPPYDSMSPESRGALVSIVTAAMDQFAKPAAREDAGYVSPAVGNVTSEAT